MVELRECLFITTDVFTQFGNFLPIFLANPRRLIQRVQTNLTFQRGITNTNLYGACSSLLWMPALWNCVYTASYFNISTILTSITKSEHAFLLLVIFVPVRNARKTFLSYWEIFHFNKTTLDLCSRTSSKTNSYLLASE